MSQSSNICCPRHPDAGVFRRVSTTPQNPNRGFYKCNQEKTDKCNFFKWEDECTPSQRPLTPPATPQKRRAESEMGPPPKRPVVAPATPSPSPNGKQARLEAIMRATQGRPTAKDDTEEKHKAESPLSSPFSTPLPNWHSGHRPAPPPTAVRTEQTSETSNGDFAAGPASWDSSGEEGCLPSGSGTASGSSEPRGTVASTSYSYTNPSADENRLSPAVSTDRSSMTAATIYVSQRELQRNLEAAEKLNDAYQFQIEVLKADREEMRSIIAQLKDDNENLKQALSDLT
ncbi:hypothetical protein MKEN_00690800 [Mycena kentingensis (nom. inval.)]|nr:hypothetical protein MKEN_00690800 [Mycena kentingensis (nom. inval.)]